MNQLAFNINKDGYIVDSNKDNEGWAAAANQFELEIKSQFELQEEKKIIALQSMVLRFLQNWCVKGYSLLRDSTYVTLMEEIIEHPKIHVPLLFGNTTLMLGAFCCCYPLLEHLIQKKCDLSIKDHHGLNIIERLVIAEKVLSKRLVSSTRVNTKGLFHEPNSQGVDRLKKRMHKLLIRSCPDEILSESLSNILRLKDYEFAQMILDCGVKIEDHLIGKDTRPILFWALHDLKSIIVGIRLRSISQCVPVEEKMRVKNLYDIKIQSILENYHTGFLMSISSIRSFLNKDYAIKSMTPYIELSFFPKIEFEQLENSYLRLKTFFLYQQIPLFNAIKIDNNDISPLEWINLLQRKFFKELGRYQFAGLRSQLFIEMLLNFFCSTLVMEQLITNVKNFLIEKNASSESIFEAFPQCSKVIHFLKQFSLYQQGIVSKILILVDLVHQNPDYLSNVILENLFADIRVYCHRHPIALALWFYEKFINETRVINSVTDLESSKIAGHLKM